MEWQFKTKWRLNVLGWNVKVLAERSGVNYNTLKASLRKGTSTTETAFSLKIAKALGLDPFWLYDPSQDMSTVKYLDHVTNNDVIAAKSSTKTTRAEDELKAMIDFLGPDDSGFKDLYKLGLFVVQEKLHRINNAQPVPPGRSSASPQSRTQHIPHNRQS